MGRFVPGIVGDELNGMVTERTPGPELNLLELLVPEHEATALAAVHEDPDMRVPAPDLVIPAHHGVIPGLNGP